MYVVKIKCSESWWRLTLSCCVCLNFVAGLDSVHPLCARGNWYVYDLNAWVGHRKVRPPLATGFVPGPLSVRNMQDLYAETEDVVQLDSVGGTMLYVRADVHCQGVIFPSHYVIGSEWGAEGYDGIETEGICYSAHFLGFKCWGCPRKSFTTPSSKRPSKNVMLFPWNTRLKFQFSTRTQLRETCLAFV